MYIPQHVPILNINICNINLNCLSNKISILYDFILRHKIDLVGVTETWLSETMPDSFVSFPGFNIFRCDSVGPIGKHGVCLYVSEGLGGV